MSIFISKDQKMSDEEATCISSDDDNEKVHDENKDCEKEEKEPDAAEYYKDQALDEEEQSSLLCENEEKNLTNTETTEVNILFIFSTEFFWHYNSYFLEE